MTERTGGCMCGAVRYTIKDAPEAFGVCNCEMCRRWTGSSFMGMTVPVENITWDGEAQIKTLQSSDWAERAWCGRCGSALYYHATVEPGSRSLEVSVGTLDDTEGLAFSSELFTDCRIPGAEYTGAEGRKCLTRAEVFAIYAPDAPQ